MTTTISLSPSFKDYVLHITALTLKTVNVLYAGIIVLRAAEDAPAITIPIMGLLGIWTLGSIHTNHLLNKMTDQDTDAPITIKKTADESVAESIPRKRKSSCLLSCIKAPSFCLDLLPKVIIKTAKTLSLIPICSLLILPYWAFFPAQPSNLVLYGIGTTLKFYPFIIGSVIFGRFTFNAFNHIAR